MSDAVPSTATQYTDPMTIGIANPGDNAIPTTPNQDTRTMTPTTTIDLLTLDDDLQMQTSPLRVISIREQEVALIPFTSEVTLVRLHWVDEPELRGYHRCNTSGGEVGGGCVLCQVGYPAKDHLLLPVFEPINAEVGVLSISPSSAPRALRPQLAATLRGISYDEPMLLMIRRLDNYTYSVQSRPLPSDIDSGTALIKVYLADVEAGRIDVACTIPTVANDVLREIPTIARKLQLRGLA
jgi:hypothetical protein